MPVVADAFHVREFTAGAGQPTPDYPGEHAVLWGGCTKARRRSSQRGRGRGRKDLCGRPTDWRAAAGAEEMSLEETCFISKMMLDEIMELFATVLPPAEAKAALKGFVDDRCCPSRGGVTGT